jgi:two-component system chemotaxis response regulator CheB
VNRIRVLIVDDGVVIRKMVADALASDPELEIVGSAANGRIALQKIEQCHPDILTLDVEMPEMDGLETLRQLRPAYPKLPVIMFSTLTERGGRVTLDALALGASDYVAKPANVGGLAMSLQFVRDELIPRIKALCRQPATSLAPIVRRVVPPRAVSPQAVIDLVAIGVSTGGPNALADLLPALPAELRVPVVIVQHMPAMFTKLLADRLNSRCQLRVLEARDGDKLEAGVAYIAPGDYHMTVQRRGVSLTIVLTQDPPENSCRPAVDVLFRSVSTLYGPHVLAVVLTGMGQDGLLGCEQIQQAGGRIFVQDEATSVVWGMPGFVARAGLAHRVLPLGQVAGEIIQAVDENRPARDATIAPGDLAAVKAR